MQSQSVQIVIGPGGEVTSVYQEILDLAPLGDLSIRRVSFVEPDDCGRWWADLSPARGRKLGPFDKRSEALAAELAWLDRHLRKINTPKEHSCGKSC